MSTPYTPRAVYDRLKVRQLEVTQELITPDGRTVLRGEASPLAAAAAPAAAPGSLAGPSEGALLADLRAMRAQLGEARQAATEAQQASLQAHQVAVEARKLGVDAQQGIADAHRVATDAQRASLSARLDQTAVQEQLRQSCKDLVHETLQAQALELRRTVEDRLTGSLATLQVQVQETVQGQLEGSLQGYVDRRLGEAAPAAAADPDQLREELREQLRSDLRADLRDLVAAEAEAAIKPTLDTLRDRCGSLEGAVDILRSKIEGLQGSISLFQGLNQRCPPAVPEGAAEAPGVWVVETSAAGPASASAYRWVSMAELYKTFIKPSVEADFTEAA